MEFFEKLFQTDAERNDDKYVLFASLYSLLANADDDVSIEEGEYFADYLISKKGMTMERYNKIVERAFTENHAADARETAKKFDKDERDELINFLIDLAQSDGHFHPIEAASIWTYSTILGFPREESKAIYDRLLNEYGIDYGELLNAVKQMKNKLILEGFINPS